MNRICIGKNELESIYNFKGNVVIEGFVFDTFELKICDVLLGVATDNFSEIGIVILENPKQECEGIAYLVKNFGKSTNECGYDVLCQADNKEKLDKYKKYGFDYAEIVLQIMAYINYQQEKREKRVIEKERNNSSKHSSNDNETSNRIYLLKDLIEYKYEYKVKSKNKIQCPCWSVRGHYRHYKNGSTIFIKDYLKGRKRKTEEPEDKEYCL